PTNSLWPNHDLADSRSRLGAVREYYPDPARARPFKFHFIKPSPHRPRRRFHLLGRVMPFLPIPNLHVVVLRRFHSAPIVKNRQLNPPHLLLLSKINLHPIRRIRRFKTRPSIPRRLPKADQAIVHITHFVKARSERGRHLGKSLIYRIQRQIPR